MTISKDEKKIALALGKTIITDHKKISEIVIYQKNRDGKFELEKLRDIEFTDACHHFVFNNKNFGLVRMGIFDNPTMFGVGSNTLGQTDNTWKNQAFFIPLSTNASVDDGLGNMGKYVRLAHKPGAFMNMWQTGGRAAANKTDVWQLGVHIVSEIAFKFINANKYGIMYNAGA